MSESSPPGSESRPLTAEDESVRSVTEDERELVTIERQLAWVRERATELEPALIEQYENFHAHPELGGREVETAVKIQQFLEERGIEILGKNIGLTNAAEGTTGTGIIAIIRGQPGGPVVALRADMDALPITEATGLPYASHQTALVHGETKGVSHACGHDTHLTGLLGATQMLKELADTGQLGGDVLLLFQPSEERTVQSQSGAVQMVKYLERSGWRSRIDAFFGIHSMRNYEQGQINIIEGAQLSSSGTFQITLRAPGGHVMNAATLPNLDEILAEIKSRLAAEFRPFNRHREAVVSSTYSEFEPKGYNILPEAANARWTVRLAVPDYKEKARQITTTIRNTVQAVIAEHQAELVAAGAHIDEIEVTDAMSWDPGYRPLVHAEAELVALAEQAAVDGAGRPVHNVKQPIFGAEDFAFYLAPFNGRRIPGAFLLVGAANPAKGIPIGEHHTSDFRLDPGVIKDNAATLTAFVLRFADPKRHEATQG